MNGFTLEAVDMTGGRAALGLVPGSGNFYDHYWHPGPGMQHDDYLLFHDFFGVADDLCRYR